MAARNFTFARGNLAKLLNLPRYLLAIPLSWLVPRDPKRWVFGSGAGIGEGALSLLQALRTAEPDASILWLGSDDPERAAQERADAARLGIDWRPKRGPRGTWHTLRAGVIVVTHGFGDVNRFGVFGGTVVQLWHGAPLKRLHLDSPATTRVPGGLGRLLAPVRRLLDAMYRAGGDRISLFVVGSATAAERISSAFGLDPARIAALGDPRVDVLARAVAQRAEGDDSAWREAEHRIRQLAGIPEDGSRLVLYAPTWRDGAPDPAVPTTAEWERLRAWAADSGSRLVIRSHPLGQGGYAAGAPGGCHLLGADAVREITPLLPGFAAVITDYSSLAIDVSALGTPVVWFAPDLDAYAAERGLYEPYRVTSGGRFARDWAGVVAELERLARDPAELAAARDRQRVLAERFHAHPEGGAAERVLAEIQRRRDPAHTITPAAPAPRGSEDAVFFESFYGRSVACNPLALDREIARSHPGTRRYWSVVSLEQRVPEGAIAVPEGSPDWHRARRAARLIVANDWLRHGFPRSRAQTVLQTWHGTMLKRLALDRPRPGLRTRLAVRRESRRWDFLLSQNPHSTAHLRKSYAYHGPVWQVGYPRTDALVTGSRAAARAALGIGEDTRALLYAPTWRDGGDALVDELDVAALAAELGPEWLILVRGHTRTHAFGSYAERAPGAGPGAAIRDVSRLDDVNPLLLASDLLVTDYSSLMFDASVCRTPMAFFVPDLARYRDRERGFTLDFEGTAPGPLLRSRAELLTLLRGDEAAWRDTDTPRYAAWRNRYNPHDDGRAAERLVARLACDGALGERASGEGHAERPGRAKRATTAG